MWAPWAAATKSFQFSEWTAGTMQKMTVTALLLCIQALGEKPFSNYYQSEVQQEHADHQQGCFSPLLLCPFYLHAVQFTSWHSNGHNWILLQILPLWFPCRLRKLTSSLFTFIEAEPSPYLESSQRKNQCTYKAKGLSAQILQSTNPQVLENTGKVHTIQKLAGMSIAEGKVAGKRKKTNRKCHTQRIQHKLWAIKARKKNLNPLEF